MTVDKKVALAIYVTWQMAVIIFQFSETFRKGLAPWQFYLCGLLPSWRMFGPQPVDGDYRLYYRTSTEKDNRFSGWQLADYDKKPPVPGALFFNPHANIVKALREICRQAGAARSERNVYYQLLLNDVIRQVSRQEPEGAPGRRLVQFQICWTTPADANPIFCSHVHPF